MKRLQIDRPHLFPSRITHPGAAAWYRNPLKDSCEWQETTGFPQTDFSSAIKLPQDGDSPILFIMKQTNLKSAEKSLTGTLDPAFTVVILGHRKLGKRMVHKS